MRITPLDVRKQEFRRSVRGYDCDEVRAFMSTLADEYEAVLMDNKQVREQMVEFEEKIAEYRNMERTLRDTLLTAERITKEARDNAAKEGGLIVKDAQLKAKQVLEECRLRTGEVRREIHALRQEKEAYLARFKGLAEAQIQFIDTHRRDFDDVDKRLLQMMDAVSYDEPQSGSSSRQRTQPRQEPRVAAGGPSRETAAVNDMWRGYRAGQDHEPTPAVTPPAVPQPEAVPPVSAVEPAAPAERTFTKAPQSPELPEVPQVRIPWASPRSQAATIDLAAMGIPVPAVPAARVEPAQADSENPARAAEDLTREADTLDAQQDAILEVLQEAPQEWSEAQPQDRPTEVDVPAAWAPEKHDLWDTLTT